MSHPGLVPATLDFFGNGRVDIAHNQLNKFWRISQVSVDATGSVLTVKCLVNSNPCTSSITAVSPLTASGEPPIDIGGHDTFSVVITEGPPEGTVTVSYYYEEIVGEP